MSQRLVIGRIEAVDLMYNIRKFDENEGLPQEDGIYESKGDFEVAIVKKCILDFRKLLHVIDQSGYSEEKPPKEIIADLAENALEQNPHFRSFFVSRLEKSKKAKKSKKESSEMTEIRNIDEKSEKTRKRILATELKGQKTLENAKNTILRIFDEMSNSEIAEKLDIFEIGVETLKNRSWAFWDCISVAEKLDLDVEVVFGRFRESREGREKE